MSIWLQYLPTLKGLLQIASICWEKDMENQPQISETI